MNEGKGGTAFSTECASKITVVLNFISQFSPLNKGVMGGSPGNNNNNNNNNNTYSLNEAFTGESVCQT